MDVGARFRATQDYAKRNGFVGGFPNFYQANNGQVTVRGTLLLLSAIAVWKDVPASELGNPPSDDVGARFRATQDYAKRNGFVGGFPNFYQADYGQGTVYGTLLLPDTTAVWKDVPSSVTFHSEGPGVGPPPSYQINTFDGTSIYAFAWLTVNDDGSWHLNGHCHNNLVFSTAWYLAGLFVAASGQAYRIQQVNRHVGGTTDDPQGANPLLVSGPPGSLSAETWESIVGGHFCPKLSGNIIIFDEESWTDVKNFLGMVLKSISDPPTDPEPTDYDDDDD
jgi:hypothetical protein